MSTEPYCPTQPFNSTNTRNCLNGRTLYVIGNSVARQNAFNIVELLGGNPTKREDQRDKCPKHETTWTDSCHQDFSGVKIKYLFLQFMDGYDYTNRSGFPFYKYRKFDNRTKRDYVVIDRIYNLSLHRYESTPNAFSNVVAWPDDNCILHSTRYCFRVFFNGSKHDDILIFTLGMSYLFTPEEETRDPKDYTDIMVDKKAWLLSSAINFKTYISETFQGQYIFRVAMAKTPKHAYTASMIPSILHINKLLTDIWENISSTPRWYTIDQVAINENRDHLYNDHIHFNGALTHATLTQMLNEVCVGRGDVNETEIISKGTQLK